MKISLFTGAGASAGLGFPTTSQFMQKIPPKMTDNKLMRLAYEFLSKRKQNVDIEKILSMLNSNLEILDYNNISYNFFLENLPAKDEPVRNWIENIKNETEELILQIKELIFEKYSKQLPGDPTQVEKLRKHYFSLFDRICSFIDKEKSFDIFTTNYDTSIEDFVISTNGLDDILKISNKQFSDGFPKRARRPEEHIWSEQNYNNGINYFKLHGSINWRYDERNEKIMQVILQRRPSDIEKYLVIYPGYKGIPTDNPFAYNHNQLATSLTQSHICIIIGFSFRDPYISSLFRWAMEFNSSLFLCIILHGTIPKSPEETKEYISKKYPDSALPMLLNQYGQRINVIDKGFGESDTIDEIGGILTKIQNSLNK